MLVQPRSPSIRLRTPMSGGRKPPVRITCQSPSSPDAIAPVRLRDSLFLELLFLRRADERERRRLTAGDGLRDEVEVAGADLALVAGRGVALLLELELLLLQADIGRHPFARVALGEAEHRRRDRVEAGEGDELEP